MNVVILRGNLGADAVVKQFEGRVLINCRLAVTERGFQTKDETVVPERTDWFDVVISAGLGTKLPDYLKKGSNVLVRGKLRAREQMDATCGKYTVVDVAVDSRDVELIKTKE